MNNMNMGSVRNNLIYIVLLIGLGIFLFATSDVTVRLFRRWISAR